MSETDTTTEVKFEYFLRSHFYEANRTFTIEELYQEFKKRLMDELQAEGRLIP